MIFHAAASPGLPVQWALGRIEWSSGLCPVQWFCVLYGTCVWLQVMLHVTFKRHMEAIQLKLGEEAVQLLQQVSHIAGTVGLHSLGNLALLHGLVLWRETMVCCHPFLDPAQMLGCFVCATTKYVCLIGGWGKGSECVGRSGHCQ